MKKQTKKSETIEQAANNPGKPLSKEERINSLKLGFNSHKDDYDLIDDISRFFDRDGRYIGPATKPSIDEWEKLAEEAMSSGPDKPAVQVLRDMKAAKIKKSLN